MKYFTETEYYLPAPPRHLPVALHPHAHQIETLSDMWLREHVSPCFPNQKAFDRFLAQHIARYSGAVYPHTPDDSRQLAVTNFNQLITVPDTLCSDLATLSGGTALSADSAQALFEELIAILRGEEKHPRTPLGRATYAVWQQLVPGMPQPLRERFVASVKLHLDGTAGEISSRASEEPPDFETYLKIHRDSIALQLVYALAEYCLGIDLTDRMAQHPATFEKIHNLAIDHVVFFNDLLSLRKELHDGDTLNSVIVLAHHERLSLQDAVNRVFELAKSAEEEFIATRDEILAGDLGQDPDVRAYLIELGYVLSGSREFEYCTPRYGGTHDWSETPRPAKRISLARIHDDH